MYSEFLKKWIHTFPGSTSSLRGTLSGEGGGGGGGDGGRISQSIEVPSSTRPGTTYPVRAIPHSNVYRRLEGIINAVDPNREIGFGFVSCSCRRACEWARRSCMGAGGHVLKVLLKSVRLFRTNYGNTKNN